MDWVLRSEATEVAIGIGYDVRSEQVVVDRGCHACFSSLSHLAVSPRRVTVRLVGGISRRPCCVQRPITVASMPQTAGHDGLDADAEQAKSIAADGPAEPKGHEDDRHHHDEAVDEDLPYVEPGQYLGQDDQERRPQHRAEQRSQAAQDDDGDELDGKEEAELLRIGEAHDESTQL